MADNADSQGTLTIERIFEAPVDHVWRMWTDPQLFAAWYGPTGATVRVARMDLRVGGTRLVCMEMSTPDGPMQMWFTGEYLEVTINQRLVYTEAMSNENGDVVAPVDIGTRAGHPTTTHVHVELEDLGERTRMVMTHIGVPADSPGAIGWRMAIDKLTAHLRNR